VFNLGCLTPILVAINGHFRSYFHVQMDYFQNWTILNQPFEGQTIGKRIKEKVKELPMVDCRLNFDLKKFLVKISLFVCLPVC
jgi:hypothetical protein